MDGSKKHSSPYTKTPNKNRDSGSFRSLYNIISSPFKHSISPPSENQQQQQQQQQQSPPQLDEPMQIEELGDRQTEDLIDWRQPDPSSSTQSPQQTNDMLASFFRDKGNRSLTSEEAVECFKMIGSSIQQPPLEQSQNIPSVALFSPGTSATPSRKPRTSSVNAFLSPARPQRNSRASLGGTMSARKRPIYMGAGFGAGLSQSKRRSSMESVGRSIGVGPPTPAKHQDTKPPPIAIDTGKRRRTEETNANSKEQQEKVNEKEQEQKQQKVQSTPSKTTHLSVSRFTKPATVVRPSPLRQVQTAESPSPEKDKKKQNQNTPTKPSSRAADAVLGVLGDSATPPKPSNETINPYQNNNPVALISKARTPRPSKLRKSVAPSEVKSDEKKANGDKEVPNALDLIEQTDPSKNKRKAQDDGKPEEAVYSPKKSSVFSTDAEPVVKSNMFSVEQSQSKPKSNPFTFDAGPSQPKTGAFDPPAPAPAPSPKKSTFEVQPSGGSAFSVSNSFSQPQSSVFGQTKEPDQATQPQSTFNVFDAAPIPKPSPKPIPKITETIDIDSDSDEEEAVEEEQADEGEEQDELEEHADGEEEEDENEEEEEEEEDEEMNDEDAKKDETQSDKPAQPQPSTFPTFPSFAPPKASIPEPVAAPKPTEKETEAKQAPFTNFFSKAQPAPTTASTIDEKEAKARATSKPISEIPSFAFTSLVGLPATDMAPGLTSKVDSVPAISFAIKVDGGSASEAASSSMSSLAAATTANPLWAAAKKGGSERSCSLCMCKSPASATKCTVCDTPF